jgi:meso-butanediol dehydrogenase/(S,S)-butanediol dehydrogenase/diacetyl reductase
VSGQLEGKVAVITGTGNGIARDVALRFAREGARIVGCDLNEETTAETVKLVRDAGGQMEALAPLDLTVETNAHDLAEYAGETFGGIDILFNSAMQMRLGAIEDLTVDDWKFTLDNTLTLQFLVTKHVVPHLRKRGGGAIVFVGSITGTQTGAGYPGNLGFLLPYACAKAGVLRMTVVLANELAEIGVRVNSISPGTVATEQGLAFYGRPGTEQRRVSELGTLVPRLGDPEDIAAAALYLASDQASWVTGQNLVVDGGFVASGGMGMARAENKAAMAPSVEEFSVVDERWETSGEPKAH